MTPEQKVQTSVQNVLKKIEDCEFEKAIVTGRKGSQDIKGHIQGFYFAFEIKKDDKTKPRPIQEYRIRRTTETGGFSRCIGSRASLLRALDEFQKEKGFKIVWKKK